MNERFFEEFLLSQSFRKTMMFNREEAQCYFKDEAFVQYILEALFSQQTPENLKVPLTTFLDLMKYNETVLKAFQSSRFFEDFVNDYFDSDLVTNQQKNIIFTTIMKALLEQSTSPSQFFSKIRNFYSQLPFYCIDNSFQEIILSLLIKFDTYFTITKDTANELYQNYLNSEDSYNFIQFLIMIVENQSNIQPQIFENFSYFERLVEFILDKNSPISLRYQAMKVINTVKLDPNLHRVYSIWLSDPLNSLPSALKPSILKFTGSVPENFTEQLKDERISPAIKRQIFLNFDKKFNNCNRDTQALDIFRQAMESNPQASDDFFLKEIARLCKGSRINCVSSV